MLHIIVCTTVKWINSKNYVVSFFSSGVQVIQNVHNVQLMWAHWWPSVMNIKSSAQRKTDSSSWLTSYKQSNVVIFLHFIALNFLLSVVHGVCWNAYLGETQIWKYNFICSFKTISIDSDKISRQNKWALCASSTGHKWYSKARTFLFCYLSHESKIT